MAILSQDFKVGQRIRIQSAFVDENDLAADPTSVTLTTTDPSGNRDQYFYNVGGEADTLVKVGTGAYQKDLTIDEAGVWVLHFLGEGAIETANFDTMIVAHTPGL